MNSTCSHGIETSSSQFSSNVLSLSSIQKKEFILQVFGDTLSFQQLLLTKADNNLTFKCVVDLADVENVTSTEITVQLCECTVYGSKL